MRCLPLFLLLFACSSQTPTSYRAWAMTMPYTIKIGDKLTSEQKKEAEGIIDEVFTEVHQIYDNWNPKSEVSNLNKLTPGSSRMLSHFLHSFFLKVDRLVTCSQNRYDPCIGARVSLSSTPLIRWKDLQWNHSFFKNQPLAIDFCGSAKGYAIDLIIERLSEKGFKSLYVEWAGEIRTLGKHPKGRSWNVQIRVSADQIDPVTIELIDAAIATSGPTKLNKEKTHIIDPNTGEPISINDTVIGSVSVRAPTCMLADGLATAAMTFTDFEKAKEWAEKIVEEYPEITIWMYNREPIWIKG